MPSRWPPIAAGRTRRSPSSGDSPVTPDTRGQFLPLAYFPVDEGYRVPAMLAPSEGEPAIEMPTSTGKRRAMRRAGRLQFSVRGQPLALTAFVEADDRQMPRLFVPFGDQTNGAETYPAGRYLDLDRTAHRPLRSRLQPRLPPVLLLQPAVRLPVSAAREPARRRRFDRASARGRRRPRA